jgi:small conductance mechanosensitive channel
MDTKQLMATLTTRGTDIILQISGALLLWFVGRYLIGLLLRIINNRLTSQKVDQTIVRYVNSSLNVVLTLLLVVSLLGAFGVQTTTFAALFAGLGLAIGTAISGLFAHFAAGFFMMILRPFKVGDFITAGGVTGEVIEIGPFVTKINTMDNILNIVGNNKIFSDTIQNFSHNPYRRVDLTMQLNHDSDVNAVIAKLRERVASVPNVLATPAPDIEVLEFTTRGPVLAVRPFTAQPNYWQVYFETNAAIRSIAVEGELTIPAQHVIYHQMAGLE